MKGTHLSRLPEMKNLLTWSKNVKQNYQYLWTQLTSSVKTVHKLALTNLVTFFISNESEGDILWKALLTELYEAVFLRIHLPVSVNCSLKAHSIHFTDTEHFACKQKFAWQPQTTSWIQTLGSTGNVVHVKGLAVNGTLSVHLLKLTYR